MKSPSAPPGWLLAFASRAFSLRGSPASLADDCGKPAAFIGKRLATGAQACFCADCKERGHEARGFGAWQVVDWAGLGAH